MSHEASATRPRAACLEATARQKNSGSGDGLKTQRRASNGLSRELTRGQPKRDTQHRGVCETTGARIVPRREGMGTLRRRTDKIERVAPLEGCREGYAVAAAWLIPIPSPRQRRNTQARPDGNPVSYSLRITPLPATRFALLLPQRWSTATLRHNKRWENKQRPAERGDQTTTKS